MIQRIITIIITLILTTVVSHSQQLQLFTNVQGMSQVYDLAFDNEGNVYAAGIASGNAAVVKLDSTGNEVWRNDLVVEMMSNRIAIAQEVFVNDSGQVFVSCAREVGDGAVARLNNSNGNIIWKKDDLNTYNRSNSQVGKYSKMLYANNRLILTVESDISDFDFLYFEFNSSNGDKLSSKIIQKPLRIGHKGLRKKNKLYNHMFIGDYPNYSQNQIEIINGGESDNFIFDSINISTPSYHINLIGLHNNKFYGVRNDFDTNKYEFSPTLVQIDSVTGDVISEQNFRTTVDSVTKGTVGLCAMTDDYGILFSGGASTPDSNYNNNIRGFKWIAQVHPQTAEVVWDTLIDMWGEYAYDHLFSDGDRHLLTGRTNTIHELTVPKIGWTPSSTESIIEKKKSKIYPNPASNVLHLDIHNPQSKVMIYTIEGKLMKETNGDQKQLDISGYPSGMYFVSIIEPNDTIETFKIVKK